MFIQSSVYDNEWLMKNSPDYVRALENLPEQRKRAMLYGDWNVFEGQYFPEFQRETHVCKPFTIPAHWKHYRVFDYGFDMFACYFVAVDEDGRAWFYREIYEGHDERDEYGNPGEGLTIHRNFAFPKFVYDIRKFPNGWDGDPGKAIAINGDVTQGFANVMGGVNLPPMVTNIVEMMRSMMQDCLGASDASLGNVKPDNTSAIIAAQKATSAPLELQKRKFEQFNEDCIRIIVDMMCACYGVRYVVTDEAQADPMTGEQIKRKTLSQLDFDALEIGQLDINVEVGAASYWSELVQTTTLDNLFNKQVISDPELFLETIPAAQVPNKNELIRSAAEQKKMAQQMAMAAPQNG